MTKNLVSDAMRRPTADLTTWRVITAARVFALATALGLIVTTGRAVHLAVPFLMLCVLAGVMSIPAPTPVLRAVRPVAEGLLAALLLTSLGEAASALLVYLLVPPFVAGLQVGVWGVLLASLAEACANAVGLLAHHQEDQLPAILDGTAPWMLVAVGFGLLGAWVRKNSTTGLSEQQRYESAHRLLAQLHAVARDLPQGLDAPSLAQRTLSYALAPLAVSGAVLLVRDASESLRELATQGLPRHTGAMGDDPLVARCWAEEKPCRGAVDQSSSPAGHRAAVPVRVGSRMIGVLVVEGPVALQPRELRAVQARLGEQSLRLDSAVLFEQVRSMATVEERHRLAREIHDGVAQEVASLGYLVDDLGAASQGDEGRQAAQALRNELTRIVNELRFSIFDLRMDVTQHGGLAQALSDYARDVGARAGMTVHMALGEKGPRLPIDVETELLRIAQEAITNARKHARANNLWVSLNTNGVVAVLRVDDDGIGSAQPRHDHYGLQMMRERADRIDAELAVTNRPQGGTSVVVALQPSDKTLPGAHRADFSATR